tara:strand:- start:2333 stop:2689 length:357 start_codon:yes stop_codon:yes gene_type:complete
MEKSLSLLFPSVPVNSKQQQLIERYKDAYIQMKVNIVKTKQGSLDTTYEKTLNELKKQNIEEIHIQSARKDADKIAHNRFIAIYFQVYKDLLKEESFYKETKKLRSFKSARAATHICV